MTSTERSRRRRRLLRLLRLREEAAALRAYIADGLSGQDEEARREIVEFLVGLPVRTRSTPP